MTTLNQTLEIIIKEIFKLMKLILTYTLDLTNKMEFSILKILKQLDCNQKQNYIKRENLSKHNAKLNKSNEKSKID